jgi:hypothetical protein
MAVLALVILVGGAFAIAVLASNARFGEPRRKDRKDETPNNVRRRPLRDQARCAVTWRWRTARMSRIAAQD